MNQEQLQIHKITGKQTGREKGVRISYLGTIIVALVYGAVLLKLVLFKNGLTTDMRGLNLIPFQFVTDFFMNDVSVSVMAKNILGNIAIFLPFGMLLPMLCHKLNCQKTILLGFELSLCFEIIQYAVGMGIADVDDLILNTVGTVLGAVIYFAGSKHLDQKFHNQFASLISVGCIGLGLFLFLNFFGYRSSLGPVPIEIVNAEVMHGLDLTQPTASLSLAEFDGTTATGTVSTYQDNTQTTNQVNYQVTENTIYIIEHRNCNYSVNGNVTKVITSYEETTKQQFMKLAKDKNWMDVWLAADGTVDTASVLVFDN